MRLSLFRTAKLCGLFLSAACVATAQDIPAPSVPPPQVLPPPSEVPLSPEVPSEKSSVQLKKGDYKDDWRQAGDGEGGLGNRLRSHIVRLDEDDQLVGRITVIESVTGDLKPVQGATIRFIRKGELKREITPGSNGEFSVNNLEPGVYSMIAAGPGAFLAWSVDVQPKLSDIAKMPALRRARYLAQIAKARLDVEAAAVPPSNFGPLKSLLFDYLPSEESSLYLDGPEVPDGMAEKPPADARSATTLKHHQVRLTRDGKLTGRIRRLQPDTGRDLKIRQLNVFLLRNNEITTQRQVKPDGIFVFEDLRPGVYSMVAAGKDGFLAFSIDVLNPPQTEATVPRKGATVKTAAFRIDDAQVSLALEMALCSPEDLNPNNLARHTGDFTRDNSGGAIAATNPPAAAPAGGGGGFPGAAPPGGGGVGGGVGGGGTPTTGTGLGLGQILTSAAVSVGVRSAIDDDDGGGGGGISSPASPGTGAGTDDGDDGDDGSDDGDGGADESGTGEDEGGVVG